MPYEEEVSVTTNLSSGRTVIVVGLISCNN
jgi:hypothetical protein